MTFAKGVMLPLTDGQKNIKGRKNKMNITYEEMPRKIEELLGDIEKLEEEKKILEDKIQRLTKGE